MIFNDIPALFGFVLTLHGIAVYVVESRRRQLVLKSLIGIALGWQVYGVLIAFVIGGLVKTFYETRSLRRVLVNDYVVVGATALALGVLLFSGNLLNEKLVCDCDFSELPTIDSLVRRTGYDDAFNASLDDQLSRFHVEQIRRVANVSTPFMISNFSYVRELGSVRTVVSVGIGLILLGLSLVVFKNRFLLLVLLLSGWAWSLPMKHFTAQHPFQAIFYVGIPIVVYCSLIRAIFDRLPASRPFVLALSLLLFLHASYSLNIEKGGRTESINHITQEFQEIVDVIGKGRAVYVESTPAAYYATEFYLSGNYFTEKGPAEYVISTNAEYDSYTLTPNNRSVFVFEAGEQTLAERETLPGIDVSGALMTQAPKTGPG